jgi:hypothetical protein
LPVYEIDLPAVQAKPIEQYAEAVFGRKSFQSSLTELEEEMRA